MDQFGDALERWAQDRSDANFALLYEQVEDRVGKDHFPELWKVLTEFSVQQLDKISQEIDFQAPPEEYAQMAAFCADKSRDLCGELLAKIVEIAKKLAQIRDSIRK